MNSRQAIKSSGRRPRGGQYVFERVEMDLVRWEQPLCVREADKAPHGTTIGSYGCTEQGARTQGDGIGKILSPPRSTTNTNPINFKTHKSPYKQATTRTKQRMSYRYSPSYQYGDRKDYRAGDRKYSWKYVLRRRDEQGDQL